MNKTVKKLGYWSIVLFGVNSIIGTGIFLTPGDVIKVAGIYAPLAYLVAGLFALTLAMVFATAARYVKTNGAAYAYTKAAFGTKVGTYVGITRAVSTSIAWGTLATAVVKTTFDIVYPLKDIPTRNYYILAGLILLMGLLLFINFKGNKIVEIMSNITTVGKLTALGVFIVVGIILVVFLGVNNYMNAEIALNSAAKTGVYSPQPIKIFGVFQIGEATAISGVIVAIISALYAFTGFESIASAAEDMESPEKNLPKAIPVTMAIVGSAYIGVIMMGMFLNPEAIVNSSNTVKLAAAIGNTALQTIIVIGALISMFGINIAASFASPRVWTALADNGALPKFIGYKNEQGVPLYAFGITALLAIAFPVILRFDVSSLAGLSVIVRFIQFLLMPIAVMVLARSKKEEWKNIPRNIWTDTIIPITGFIASVCLVLVYNFPSIIFNKGTTEKGATTYVSANGFNSASISFMIILFIIVPALVFVYMSKNKTENI